MALTADLVTSRPLNVLKLFKGWTPSDLRRECFTGCSSAPSMYLETAAADQRAECRAAGRCLKGRPTTIQVKQG